MTRTLLTPASRPRLLLLVAVLLALAIVIAGLWLAFRPATGLVQAMADADSVKVSTKISARIAELHVREGERVSAGQTLFTLTSPEVEARFRQANAVLDAARAQAAKAEEGARAEQIRAAEANWKRAKTASDLARATATRLDRLHKEGVITRQQRDETLAQATAAEALTQAARAQYDEALAGARREDREAANAQVRQAEAAVAEVTAARDETLGLAPSAGEVSKRLADVGELVPAGYPVFTLVDIDNMWVSFTLREDQFGGVSMARRLKGDIPALGLTGVYFQVYFISPAGDFATWRATRQSAGYDVKSFEVRARPVAPITGFRPGMSVLFPWPQP
ncbi:HlyD family secretion protein [Cellvibrio japonicus]|uniref:HlyD family secretion protein n=1 Tax=Cellvibrio japonicus (strain Ueda107) TaxID=498211 RepID=B3PDY5_CELJU|nr:HlyD family efflux transporter periplasmic adaptor subunit [Cellvibrio japonicus]ACE82789.1 HlyD family secretion protein [Cellvibrio japonicus Ueda107]QEI13469.1 biotin/lipoyl-binding protein [Cellvibrio japonicus]QEI17043.1 biotin/lipoyl-binding protein [Cellvibrio japonicus]QEI20621.1 biotin/lipoyl-binding protein [Cellvibrio japonicus]